MDLLIAYAVAIALGVVANRSSRRQMLRDGFRWTKGAGTELTVGLLLAAAAMLAVFGTEAGLGLITIEGVSVDAETLIGGLVVLVLLSVVEEAVMRGLMVPGLLALVQREWIALALMLPVGVLTHAFRPDATVLSMASAALGYAMYTLAYLGTGRIWMPIGLHIAWNVVQGPVLGFPVSGDTAGSGGLVQQTAQGNPVLHGGGYGPEGGVVGIVGRLLVIAALPFAFRRLRKRRRAMA